jgi:hypothetical protein
MERRDFLRLLAAGAILPSIAPSVLAVDALPDWPCSRLREVFVEDDLRPTKASALYDVDCRSIPWGFANPFPQPILRRDNTVLLPSISISATSQEELKKKENRILASLLSACAAPCMFVPSPQKKLTLQALNLAFSDIEHHDLRVANIIVNPAMIPSFESFKLNYDRPWNFFWGATIRVSKSVPPNCVIFAADPEYVGPFSIHAVSESPEGICERVSAAVLNDYAVTKLTIGDTSE